MDSHMKDTSLDAASRATIESTYTLFVIHTNHVTTIPDTSLYTLCERVYANALTNFSLTAHADLLPLRAILTATFDAAHRAFVLDDGGSTTRRILAALDADARACIFAQAVAGLVAFFRAVACRRRGPVVVTPDRVAALLRAFGDSEARGALLQAVEMSPVWSDCFEKAQIGDMIMRAVCGRGFAAEQQQQEDKVESSVSVAEVDADVVNEPVFNDGPHPQRNLGVPDVFTIMVLN